MMTEHKAFHWLMYANMAMISAVVLLGTYWYFIDELIQKPLVFYVDETNFETDKDVYNQQETVRIKTAFCKTRSSSGQSTWSLVDTYVRPYQTKQGSLQKGCYGLDNDLWVEVQKLPPELPPGEYYFSGVGIVELNPIKNVEYHYQTKPFKVK